MAVTASVRFITLEPSDYQGPDKISMLKFADEIRTMRNEHHGSVSDSLESFTKRFPKATITVLYLLDGDIEMVARAKSGKVEELTGRRRGLLARLRSTPDAGEEFRLLAREKRYRTRKFYNPTKATLYDEYVAMFNERPGGCERALELMAALETMPAIRFVLDQLGSADDTDFITLRYLCGRPIFLPPAFADLKRAYAEDSESLLTKRLLEILESREAKDLGIDDEDATDPELLKLLKLR